VIGSLDSVTGADLVGDSAAGVTCADAAAMPNVTPDKTVNTNMSGRIDQPKAMGFYSTRP
jgi:hypothetical protein